MFGPLTPHRDFCFSGIQFAFELRIVEPDQQISGFDAVVELDENLLDDGGHRGADAKLAPFGLNAAGRCCCPGWVERRSFSEGARCLGRRTLAPDARPGRDNAGEEQRGANSGNEKAEKAGMKRVFS